MAAPSPPDAVPVPTGPASPPESNPQPSPRSSPRSNAWGTAAFEVSLIGLLLSFGLLSPLGLLLGVIGLRRAPRGMALGGVMLGALGSLWLAATLLDDEPLHYDSGEYGTIHVVRGSGESDRAGPLRVEVRGETPDARVDLFYTEEQYAYMTVDPAWEETVRGTWWLGVSPRRGGSARSDTAGVATFEVSFPPRLIGRLVRLQAVVHGAGEEPAGARTFTDAVLVTVGGDSVARAR